MYCFILKVILINGCKICGFICMVVKCKEDFIVIMYNMIFVFVLKEKGLILFLFNIVEVIVFNFYFLLWYCIFYECVILLYCFWNFIKNIICCFMFCFRVWFIRMKIKFFRIFLVFCFFCWRNIMLVISFCWRFSVWIFDCCFFEKYRVVWSWEVNVKGRLINWYNVISLGLMNWL